MEPTAIYGLTADILDTVEAAINAILPDGYQHDRVGVVNGPPAIDGWGEACTEHLVAWAEIGTATESFPAPLGRAILCAPPSLALQIVVQSIRCEPTIDGDRFPAMADLDLAARLLTVEGYIAWNACTAWLLGNRSGEGNQHVDGMLVSGASTPPQGGVAGWETRLVVEVEACGPLMPTDDVAIDLPDAFLP